MSAASIPIARYIGLDVHKHYLVAYGVDRDQNRVYGPRRVDYDELPGWILKELNAADAVALEMTTNTWQMVDLLEPFVGSVTVVHPPEVKAIVKARVMTDKKAARILAQLLAAGLLPPVWVPPQDVREIRSLVAGRRRTVALSTEAKNTLHAILHAHHLLPPAEVKDIFHPKERAWWDALPLSPVEMTRVQVALETLDRHSPAGAVRGGSGATGRGGRARAALGPTAGHRSGGGHDPAGSHRRHPALSDGDAASRLRRAGGASPRQRPGPLVGAHHQGRAARHPASDG